MSYFFSFLHYNNDIFFFIALLFILFYEVINGFHDSANSIAFLVYTRSMSECLAILVSGLFSFLGVLFGGLSVAYAIVNLLPINLLSNINSLNGFIAIFSILLSAMLWNLSTWYFGLPTSSSHTLIGALIGINVTNAIVNHSDVVNFMNLDKITYILLFLIVSPFFGLIFSGSLVFVLKKYYNFIGMHAYVHETPVLNKNLVCSNKKPLLWVKFTLILSSIGISYFHGANDGQKGIGLIMLVLVCIFPSKYLINLNTSKNNIMCTRMAVNNLEKYYLHDKIIIQHNIKNNVLEKIIKPLSFYKNSYYSNDIILNIINITRNLLNNVSNYTELNVYQRNQLRQSLLSLSKIIDMIYPISNNSNQKFLYHLKFNLLNSIEYAPFWVIIFIALSLSIGTLIGWKRIALTFQNKIGKKDITYIQSMSAQLTTAISVGVASCSGIPVSTTHIMSSAIVGTVLVNKNGLNVSTIKRTVIAWILTIPISIILTSTLYWINLQCIN